MKWIILLAAAVTLSAPAVTAQPADTALLFVHYKFSQVRDTTDRANPYKEDMVLAVGRTAGVYRSYQRQLQTAQTKRQIQEQASAGGPVRVNIHTTGTATEYFQFPNDHRLVREESLFGSFLITEPLPVINWQISADTASFGSLLCQKATAHFKGRDYIAWFCPDLPLHVGPWELNGLPGVIVEAYDVKKEVQFLFDGVEKATPTASANDQAAGQPPVARGKMPPPLPGMEDMNNDPNLIQLPANATKTTDKEFARLQAAFRKDPDAFAQSMLAARNAAQPGDNGPKMKMNFKPGPHTEPVINNPIELPEKQ
ncbi:MAG TPA: GLPGLI family protein [Puia sp.]|jgi:GLPGLI family protein|nr:GLPGLI family protein [Puia sp.]